MFKKIALATALVASASFATWDYFPVQEAGKGTAEAGLYYDTDDDWSQAGIKVGARYSVIQNLEISLQGWGFQFWGETDCKGCANGGGGLRDLTIGARYQILPIVSAFVDVNLPIGSDDYDGPGTTRPTSDEVAIYLGGQFAQSLAEGLMLGAEAGFDWGFEHDNYERGLEIHMGAEVDYTIKNIGLTPYIGLQFKLQLTEDTREDDAGHEWGADDSGDTQINLWLGASYAINQMISVKAQLNIRSGDMDGDATGLYVAADFNF